MIEAQSAALLYQRDMQVYLYGGCGARKTGGAVKVISRGDFVDKCDSQKGLGLHRNTPVRLKTPFMHADLTRPMSACIELI